jgi:hypothetical protein
MCCWDLLTLSMAWMVPGYAVDMISHPQHDHFTVILQRPGSADVVATYEAQTGNPVASWASSGAALSRVFYPSPGSLLCSHLLARSGGAQGCPDFMLVLSADRRIGMPSCVTSTSADEERDREAEGKATLLRREFRTLFTGPGVNSSQGGDSAQEHMDLHAQLGGMLEAPSHLLPAAPDMCSVMLRSLLLPPAR